MPRRNAARRVSLFAPKLAPRVGLGSGKDDREKFLEAFENDMASLPA
jgi:hypothetical protein